MLTTQVLYIQCNSVLTYHMIDSNKINETESALPDHFDKCYCCYVESLPLKVIAGLRFL